MVQHVDFVTYTVAGCTNEETSSVMDTIERGHFH